jgi:siroheme synthase
MVLQNSGPCLTGGPQTKWVKGRKRILALVSGDPFIFTRLHDVVTLARNRFLTFILSVPTRISGVSAAAGWFQPFTEIFLPFMFFREHEKVHNAQLLHDLLTRDKLAYESGSTDSW